MKISDFELLGTVSNDCEKVYLAEVTVTSRRFFWFASTRRRIVREVGGPWIFADTGEFCPGYQCQQLERAWNARKLFDRFNNGQSHD